MNAREMQDEIRFGFKYTAADILGVNGSEPKYRGGLKRYQGDRKAHRGYQLWHLLVTKGRCRTCARALD